MNSEYATVKHLVNNHNGASPDFKFSLHGSWKTSLERQLQEAIKIDQTPNDLLMNSKAEWGSNSIPRITIHQDSDKAEGRQGGVKRFPAPHDVVPSPTENQPEGQRMVKRVRRNERTKEKNWSTASPTSGCTSSTEGSSSQSLAASLARSMEKFIRFAPLENKSSKIGKCKSVQMCDKTQDLNSSSQATGSKNREGKSNDE